MYDNSTYRTMHMKNFEWKYNKVNIENVIS